MSTVIFLYGWESIKPRQMTTLERAYRKALAEYDEAVDAYVQSVDFWEDMRMKYGDNSQQVLNAEILMNHCDDRCTAAETKKHDAWMKLNCPHTHVKPVIELIPGTEPYNVCVLCGAAEDDFHTPTIHDIEASE